MSGNGSRANTGRTYGNRGSLRGRESSRDNSDDSEKEADRGLHCCLFCARGRERGNEGVGARRRAGRKRRAVNGRARGSGLK